MTTLRDRLEHWHTVTSETNTPPEPLFDIAEDAVERIRELEDERDIFARTLDKRDAENKRLREALALIEDSSEHEHHYAVRLARKALEGET